MGVQQPSRTTALVLATPFGIFDDEHPGVDMFGLMARDVQRHLYADPTGPVALAHNPPSADAYEQGLAAIRRVQTLGAASNYLFPVPDTGIAARLYRVAGVPTVLLWGGRDGVVPADSARGWTRLLPEATSEVVPEAAHMLPYESDAVSTHLHRLLVG